MGMKISTGLAKGLLDTGSLSDLLSGMTLKIYGGTEPVSADAALGSANLLCEISLDGLGGAISFEPAAVQNVLQKNSSETWKGTVQNTGVATFCRMELGSDTGNASTSEVRIQGDVGIAGKFLNLSSASLTASAEQVIANLAIAIPLQG
ncbi:hypothetical protein EGJ23_01655 [Pseudomonas sp. o96-267]|uniref:hypothetical protein n=1 Tax=Pseudomonas sp. o96-267 TaxID=2479853 RepID=UPI000F77227D|nr:hypothetical protein [Pseudomonas sp. o96-267]RRV29669.1 hypothetical protein EGJ23_01655 [Pseudomonas sp. o96-267]